MIRTLTPLQAPYIKVEAQVMANSIQNGKKLLPQGQYVVAPSAKKIATYIINQIFGNDIVTQVEGLKVGWLMPTLKRALETSIYQKEAFIYIHKFNNKIYLECLKPTDLCDIVQTWDIVSGATIVQEYYNDNICYLLKRIIQIQDGISKVEFKAYLEKNDKEEAITINQFNAIFNTEYEPIYILPYEVLINIDIGEDFFANSRQFIISANEVLNTLIDEVRKTKTKIVTSQHYTSGDITMAWQPNSTNFMADNLKVNLIRDYFTLLPGDRDHAFFEYLQGEVRYQAYIDTFKFYDYQIIQMAGLSPASFGYEKDAYQNTNMVDVNKSASEMTIETIKIQIKPQINKLIENIAKSQQALKIENNLLPIELEWDYGANEAFDDIKKIQVLKMIQTVSRIPQSQKLQVITPILKKLIDENTDDEYIKEMLNEINKSDKLNIEYGEI